MNRELSRLSGVMSRLHGEAEIRLFLESILTRREVRDITLRWRLVEMLHAGETQRSIARRLRVSLCKITRGARELKKADSPFKKALTQSEDPDGVK